MKTLHFETYESVQVGKLWGNITYIIIHHELAIERQERNEFVKWQTYDIIFVAKL